MHAVSAHHEAGLEDGARRAAHPHPRATFLQGFDAAVQVQVVGPERIGEDPLQVRPVQAIERCAERIPVPLRARRDRDPVTVAAIAVDERGGLGRHPGQGFTQADVPHHPGRVGRERDRRAHLTQLAGLLQDLSGDTALPQQQGQGQPAHPGSDDHDRWRTGHGVSSRRGLAGSACLCIVTGAGSRRPTAGLPFTYQRRDGWGQGGVRSARFARGDGRRPVPGGGGRPDPGGAGPAPGARQPGGVV